MGLRAEPAVVPALTVVAGTHAVGTQMSSAPRSARGYDLDEAEVVTDTDPEHTGRRAHNGEPEVAWREAQLLFREEVRFAIVEQETVASDCNRGVVDALAGTRLAEAADNYAPRLTGNLAPGLEVVPSTRSARGMSRSRSET